MPKQTIDQQQEAWAQRMLERIEGDANRDAARRFVITRKARGCKTGSIANYVHALRKLSVHLKGQPFREASTDNVAAFVAEARSKYSPTSLRGMCALLVGFYSWLHGDEPLRRSFREAFRVRGGKPRDLLVTDEEFGKLVAACALTRDKAMFWLLRETGFRISEIASLNIGSIQFTAGGADIVIPQDGARLKTGPRTVPIVEGGCTRILRALIAERPDAGPGAPLFVAYSDRNRGERLDAHHFNAYIRQARQRAGITKKITAHSHRHTKATELARKNWNNELINRFMGWYPGSRMAGVYVHVTHEDLQTQVRRDAGYADPRPTAPAPVPQTLAVAETAAATARVFAEAFGLAWKAAQNMS